MNFSISLATSGEIRKARSNLPDNPSGIAVVILCAYRPSCITTPAGNALIVRSNSGPNSFNVLPVIILSV
ncbi:MAG: hypothetical protein ACTSRP_02005 [Candidatus Helarchaeota archaeon]